MNIIKFPGLNIELNISRIAFSIKNIDIYWYGIIIAVAIIIAILILKLKDKKFNIKFEEVLDLSIYVIPISILSARAYYVLFNLDYYIQNPTQILNFRTGGLAIYGAIIGGLITCYIYCKKRKIDILNLLDYIAPAVALRTINRKVGKLYKSGSIWRYNRITMENGNIQNGRIYRGSSYIFIRISINISYFYIINNKNK